MSLNNIQLPGVVLAGLYKKGLIQGEPAETTTEAPAKAAAVQQAPPEPVTAKAPEPVTAPAKAPAVAIDAPAAAAAYKFLGNNNQRVSIIVRSPGEVFLPEAHLQLLTKMLGACKLNLGDVAIVNDATQPVTINQLREQLSPQKVLLFGIGPDEAGLPMHFPHFKSQDYAGCTYLHAPSLQALNIDNEEGKLLKKQLWESLKRVFGV